MKPIPFLTTAGMFLLAGSFALAALAQEKSVPAEPTAAQPPGEQTATGAPAAVFDPVQHNPATPTSARSGAELSRLSRSTVLVGSLTVFALAVFVGFEVIAKVPPTLHTPLMSGSNAISGITVVGSIIAAGNSGGGIACFIAMIAVALATVNVVGGFLVTHRMLLMFKKR